MKGDTYAKALKVGFSEEQAGFLARMSRETRAETIEYLDGRERDRKEWQRKRREKIELNVGLTIALMVVSALIGPYIARAIML